MKEEGGRTQEETSDEAGVALVMAGVESVRASVQQRWSPPCALFQVLWFA